ncbi:helix-turn-helix domain-containing protein [Streptomyces sp. SS1-1]|uniref:helix-turn-helix transcriptional regulator n=1 Tax=Streptomyces sp. SS1-1 TaxID=2651869 RepID=UPI00124FB356|nr:helix-turn-helix transcriptional regulator [Streptomyces sp. SS1-1]KAB2971003.1 helix-turn-helix domain-containing protein [Streptomyces sp. SS1-1]
MDRRALGEFLRHKRERISPAAVGLPRGPRRRTPGLRREEVAQLAHVSVDHYTRLEQARGRNPSQRVLVAVARALRLTDLERAHLFRLAGMTEDEPAGEPPREVPASTLNLLDRLPTTPAVIVDSTCRVLAWNPLAAALFEDFSALPDADRNVVRRYFLDADSENGKRLYGMENPGPFALSALSYLRIAATRYPQSREIRELIEDLLAGSEEFRRLWRSPDLRIEHHASQRFDHPEIGPIELDFDILSLPEQRHQLILLSAEPGSPAEQALQVLGVIGVQRVAAES